MIATIRALFLPESKVSFDSLVFFGEQIETVWTVTSYRSVSEGFGELFPFGLCLLSCPRKKL